MIKSVKAPDDPEIPGAAAQAHGYGKQFAEVPVKVRHWLPKLDCAGSDLGRTHAFQGLWGKGLPQ